MGRLPRIHRLGQSQRVQVILLVASQSYEERVLGLVQGKRTLFDNVVDPDATEDVVGVSRRLAEVLAEDLAETTDRKSQPSPAAPPAIEGASGEPAGETTSISSPTAGADDQLDTRGLPAEEVRRCVVALQETFGARIERILASRGGLLVVLDRADEAADRLGQQISERIPIALIDRRTLAGLQRLGAGSPVAEAETLFETSGAAVASELHPLAQQAQSKLEAAVVLLAQIRSGAPLCGPTADLLLGALLSAAALLTGLDEPPAPREAGIWLYGDAIPKGAIDQADAALLMRAVALAQAGDSVPAALLQELAVDSETFVRRVIARA